MAVDSENKRRSVSNFFLFVLPPVSDGSLNVNDRMQVSGLYSGINPGAPPSKRVVEIRLKTAEKISATLVVLLRINCKLTSYTKIEILLDSKEII